jgi:hypothetical protein
VRRAMIGIYIGLAQKTVSFSQCSNAEIAYLSDPLPWRQRLARLTT